MTGPAIGRPKSATFRTMDIAGLDILGHVVSNLSERLPGRAADFALPGFVQQMIARGSIGEKAGAGFYRRQKDAENRTEILTLDPVSLEYRPRQAPKLPALDAARGIDDVGARIRALFTGRDRVGAFLRETLGPTLLYTARVAPDIAHSIDDVDRAMQWGFGWELGPFEIFDAIGVREVLEASGVAPADAPPLVGELLGRGANRFRDGRVPPAGPERQILRAARDRGTIVKRNPGASLVDLGDGVLAVEFHSKMNAIGGDTLEMLHAGVAEAARNFAALVVGNDAPNFSAGANLMLLLLEAQEGNWDEIDLMVRDVPGCDAGAAVRGGAGRRAARPA